MDIVEAAGLLSRTDKETYVSDLKRREEELLRLAEYAKYDSDREDYKRRAFRVHVQWEKPMQYILVELEQCIVLNTVM